LHIIAHHFAAAAKNALVQFAYDGRGSIFPVCGLFSFIMNFPDSQPVGHVLKIAVARLRTNQTIGRMIGKDQFHDRSSGIDSPDAVGAHFHSVGSFRATCRSQVSPPFYFHHTYPATSGFVLYIQVFQLHVTQSRNGNPYAFCRFQNRGPFGNDHWLIIDGYIYHIHSKQFIKLGQQYGIELALFVAHTALDTQRLVNKMDFPLFSCNSSYRTIAETEGTTCAFIIHHQIPKQRFALSRRTTSILHMGYIFILKIFQG
jgi:hypothetical protein